MSGGSGTRNSVSQRLREAGDVTPPQVFGAAALVYAIRLLPLLAIVVVVALLIPAVTSAFILGAILILAGLLLVALCCQIRGDWVLGRTGHGQGLGWSRGSRYWRTVWRAVWRAVWP